MLEVKALTKKFGNNTAVDAVSFTVDQPRMIGI
ncbi:MAG: phosphonate ABC transporter ATP-binding protein, partial [Donghicola eburneus]|nr:phosphonate ABC transporter ATP-binding protein [Donghicola eburneus]